MIDSIACSFSITGQGPALFLIHGIGASRQTWHKALPSLAAHFTVVTYDLRGHGESPLPDGDFVLDDLVEDLEKVRQRSGFEQADFAGHSLGGMIGPAGNQTYARRTRRDARGRGRDGGCFRKSCGGLASSPHNTGRESEQ